VTPDSPTKLLFGDVLALARERWVRAMAQRLSDQGFPDYRRSDPLVLRSLRSGEVALGSLSTTLGITRQGARKVVSGLVERGFARVIPSTVDSRRRIVELTPKGREYLTEVVATLRSLNDEVVAGVDAGQLAAAYSVLEFVKDGFGLSPNRRSELFTTGES
jgi:DNA-binding MarR family transcriptional regulator